MVLNKYDCYNQNKAGKGVINHHAFPYSAFRLGEIHAQGFQPAVFVVDAVAGPGMVDPVCVYADKRLVDGVSTIFARKGDLWQPMGWIEAFPVLCE